jgi:hypothetical protein
MTCDKCHAGAMVQDRIRRFSSGVVVLGYLLWIPAAFLALGATSCALFVGASAAKTVVDLSAKQKAETLGQLWAIDGLPKFVSEEFERTSTVSQSTINSLPMRQSAAVAQVMALRDADRAGGAIGTAISGGVSFVLVAIAYAVAVPTFILGLVFTLRRSVWRCGSCGYVFDRA